MKLSNGALAICVTALSVSLATAAGAGAAMNQAPGPTTPGYSAGKNPQTVDDATLKRAAAAYVKVQHITLETRRILSNTNDANKQHQIIRQAELKEIAAVKRQGMQPQEYNQVILLVRNNDQLQRKFLSYVHQTQGASGETM